MCLGKKVFVLYAGRERGQFSAHLEIAGATRTADSTIRTFCAIINNLPNQARTLWNSATLRSFSIGVEAGTRPSPRDFKIRPRTIHAVAALDAQIVLTVYPPQPTYFACRQRVHPITSKCRS